jgi:hypothetical protein
VDAADEGAESQWRLPELVPFDASKWAQLEEHLYTIFRQDFLDVICYWRGRRVTVQREPILNGKEDGFWHVTTETGPSGLRADRVPDPRRCERIAWLRAVLTAPEPEVRVFGQKRGQYQHFGVALPDFSFVVFLREWPSNVQLKTAYCVEAQYKRDRFRQQWEADKR